MKYYIFRKDENGFNDWLASISHFRFIIKQYEGAMEWQKPGWKAEFLEAFEWYQRYLSFCKLLTDNQKEFVRIKASHKISPYSLLNGNEIEDIFHKWELGIAYSPLNQLKEITNEEVGSVIKKAREKYEYSRKEMADLIGINQETLKAYENGKRTLPFDVYYKLKQLLIIEIED